MKNNEFNNKEKQNLDLNELISVVSKTNNDFIDFEKEVFGLKIKNFPNIIQLEEMVKILGDFDIKQDLIYKKRINELINTPIVKKYLELYSGENYVNNIDLIRTHEYYKKRLNKILFLIFNICSCFLFSHIFWNIPDFFINLFFSVSGTLLFIFLPFIIFYNRFLDKHYNDISYQTKLKNIQKQIREKANHKFSKYPEINEYLKTQFAYQQYKNHRQNIEQNIKKSNLSLTPKNLTHIFTSVDPKFNLEIREKNIISNNGNYSHPEYFLNLIYDIHKKLDNYPHLKQ